MLSRLSHELRTPLNSVIGFSRVLGTNRAGNQRAEDLVMLERIRASGERLLDLVEDLFDVTAPPPAPLALVPVNVAAAAATAVRERLVPQRRRESPSISSSKPMASSTARCRPTASRASEARVERREVHQ